MRVPSQFPVKNIHSSSPEFLNMFLVRSLTNICFEVKKLNLHAKNLRVAIRFQKKKRSSRPGEPPPEPLTVPYVNLSIHTALIVQSHKPASLQCANSPVSLSLTFLIQATARLQRPLSFLYFLIAQRTRIRFRCLKTSESADL